MKRVQISFIIRNGLDYCTGYTAIYIRNAMSQLQGHFQFIKQINDTITIAHTHILKKPYIKVQVKCSLKSFRD